MATKKNEVVEQGLTLEQMQAQMAAMMAEMAAMRAEAEKLTNGKLKTTERIAEIEADKARGEELVEVKLFKDTGKYKDDVFVGCNGETIAIKRGERVQIKRKFAEILDNSEHQDYETSMLIEQKSAEWAKASAEL